MYPELITPDPYWDFCTFAAQYPHMKAICYVHELWQHPDRIISATRLYCLYNNADPSCLETNGVELHYSSSEYDLDYPPELPIRICDYTTLD